MRKTNEKMKTNHGITLIALVITIIVMIILVVVTVTMAVNGGLFEKAASAGKQTNEKVEQELEFANVTAGMTLQELINKYTKTTGTDSDCIKCFGLGYLFESHCITCDSKNITTEYRNIYEYECLGCGHTESYDTKVTKTCTDCGSSMSLFCDASDYYKICVDCGSWGVNQVKIACDCVDCATCYDEGTILIEYCRECGGQEFEEITYFDRECLCESKNWLVNSEDNTAVCGDCGREVRKR